ncbi:hypothetical protein [Halomonas urumqiensis]|uniref:Uncharacterized protein n=1 Tax=Halomonas urumqiensis TaxID=1684789 RepID=A0A2N7UMU2_9GAMM|nr:hypothetical protein [Halomonas urumqiensis]PMR81770.1 hypothetical protein C1H70_05115 [Halomonas urumqiensis]PTB02407.1 hypothetical protein C6V82_12095 [Halomonas urumqiensis]GHE21891.1 hypothetical protein GCM10017767_24120 [Halomonas urumqiensis]
MLRLGLLLLVAPILVLLGVYFWELGDVRECTLSGGHWDYLEGVCRDTPQPFVSWLQRHPWLVNGGMLLSVIGMGMCMVGLYVKKR